MTLFDNQSLFSSASKESVHEAVHLPIESAITILERSNYQGLLSQLKKILPFSIYNRDYYPAIVTLTEYVQILPAHQQSMFSEMEGLLEYSLSYAVNTLILGIERLYPKQKSLHTLKVHPMQAVELYAAFTAALFKSIDLLVSYYKITLYDKDQKLLGIWNPFIGSMCEIENAHAFSFNYLSSSQTIDLIQGCLASIILYNNPKTKSGFLLLTEYPGIYQAWLAAMLKSADRIPVGSMMELLPFAEKQAIDKRLRKKLTIEKSYMPDGKTNFYHAQSDDIHTKSTLGKQFIDWLRARITQGTLSINSQEAIGIRRVREGILIAQSELLAFSEKHQVDAKLVEAQFQEMIGLYSATPNERIKRSVGLGGAKQLVWAQWLLIHNPALLFSLGGMPPLFINTPVNTQSPYQNLNTFK